MSSHLLSRCKTLTHDLMERPLNAYFLEPVKDLENYFNIIQTPMDFQQISNKLKNNEYSSAIEWYNDVCLIYDNAMKYHTEKSTFYLIAKYNKNEFMKLAIGIGCPDPQTWYDLTCKTMQKLSISIANGPVPQGIDPLLLTIIKKAESMPPPTSQSIADLVSKLNSCIEERNIKLDVISILKETQSSLDITGDKLSIDADSLSDLTLNALSLYVKAH